MATKRTHGTNEQALRIIMLGKTGAEAEVLRVVLLGKTGAGKSSTGNTLLHDQVFQVARGLKSGTNRCQWTDAEVEGITLEVTDAPGLSDIDTPDADVHKEVSKSIAVACPGPHIILNVIRGDSPFSTEDFTVYKTLKTMFGPDVKRHMIVVFVGIDTYGDTLEIQKECLRKEMKEASGPLKEILDDAENRFFGINNRASQDDRNKQAAELIQMMKALKTERGGAYFQNKTLDEVNALVDPLVDGRVANGHMSRAEATRQTNQAIVDETESPGFFSNLLNILPLITRGLQAAEESLKMVERCAELVQQVRRCSLM